MLIPNVLTDIEGYLERCRVDAILLSNGNNVGPLDDAEKSQGIDDVSPERDQAESRMISFAIKKNRPVLGACRGFQILNTFFGGMLQRDLAAVTDVGHVGTHEIDLIDPAFSESTGKNTVCINSFHNQGVLLNQLGKDLRAFAMAEDGVVEGFYHESLPITGIQWHPERRFVC